MITLPNQTNHYIPMQVGSVANREAQQEETLKRQRRAVVVDKALQMLNQSTRPEAITIEYLVSRMNLPQHIFMRLFDSIEDVQDALIETIWKELMRDLRKVATRTSGRDGLNSVIEAYRAFVTENRGSYYLAVCQGRDTPAARKYVSRLGRLLYIVLASCNLGSIDLHRASRNLSDILHGLAVIEISGETDKEADSTVTELLRVYLKDLFAEG